LRALFIKPNDPAALRLQKRIEGAGNQEQDFASGGNALRDGQYEDVLRVADSYAGVARFDQLKRQAQEENRTLQDARRRFALGDYTFIAAVERLAYGVKPPFAVLLADGRREAGYLATLSGFKQAGDTKKAQDLLAQLPRETTAKAAFLEIKAWADREPLVQARQDQARPTAATLESHDRLLENWEALFGIRRSRDVKAIRPNSLSSSQREFCLAQLKKMEADYTAARRLPDTTLKGRIDTVRSFLTGSGAVRSPVLTPPRIEPFIPPVPSR
jgi:hypothetical protein